jgi:hypothetical protein
MKYGIINHEVGSIEPHEPGVDLLLCPDVEYDLPLFGKVNPEFLLHSTNVTHVASLMKQIYSKQFSDFKTTVNFGFCLHTGEHEVAEGTELNSYGKAWNFRTVIELKYKDTPSVYINHMSNGSSFPGFKWDFSNGSLTGLGVKFD